MDFGYANGKVSLFEHLKSLGYSEDDILAAGNVVKNENGKVYDRFFSRLMFPIFDVSGRVIAFGGRVFNDSKPKYLNSAENVVYYKSKHLYMMNFAVKEKLKQILIVEGYMDALSLQKSGINFAVASLGTALTEGQAKLIKKYTDNVIIGYDQDSAGREATLRAMDILAKENLNIKVLKLDKEAVKDPDEYVTKFGTEKFLNCIASSVPMVEYKISIFENDFDKNDVTSKVKFLNRISEVLVKITNSMEREIYIDRVSKKYQISKGAIENEVNKGVQNKEETVVTVRDVARKYEMAKSSRKKIEQYIIALMISKDKKIYDVLEENIDETMIITPGINKLYKYIKELAKSYDIFKIDILSRVQDDDLIKELTDVMYIDDMETNKYKLLEDVLKYMKKEKLHARRKEIFEEISKDISNDEKEVLQVELSEISLQLAQLK
ncbi:MAG: DNA primase [Clostridia bacterium]|nr:DNA primase [Clostridia bacterium]